MTKSSRKTAKLLNSITEKIITGSQNPEEDAQIDQITAEYTATISQPHSTAQLNQAITHFLQSLHATALFPPKNLPEHEAFAIAINIINQAYGQEETTGYDIILLDLLIENSLTIDSIIHTLAEGIKQTRHQARMEWIIAQVLGDLDTQTQQNLVKEILRRQEGKTGESISPRPEALILFLPELLQLHVSSQVDAKSILQEM
jgi:hypothetical protein